MIALSTKHAARFYPAVAAAVLAARLTAAAASLAAEADDQEMRKRMDQAEAETRNRLMGEGPGYCYLLKVPTVWERADYFCAVAAHGVRIVDPEEFRASAREGIEAAYGGSPAAERYLADLERFYELSDSIGLGGGPSGDAGTEEILSRGNEIVAAIRENYPPYRELMREESRGRLRMRLLLAQAFVQGAEGEGAPKIERGTAGLSDASLDVLLLNGDLAALEVEINRLMNPDPDAVGNSASPALSSPRAPAISTAAKPRRTARRGRSSASSTSATQH